MKKILAVILVLVLAAGLTGCMYVEDSVVINEDGTGIMNSVIMIEKDTYDSMRDMFASLGDGTDIFEGVTPDLVYKDGKMYYQAEETQKFASLEELGDQLEEHYEDVYVTESGVRFVINEAAGEDMTYEEVEAAYSELGVDIKNAVTAVMSFTMPQPVLAYSEGGEISEDQKTVTYTFDMESLCSRTEVMVSTAEEETKPTMNVTHKKTYKNAKTVTVKDASGIKAAKYKEKGGEYKEFDFTMTFTKNGTYTVSAEDYYGNKRARTFTIKDETKPKVSGVTNKKTYTTEREIAFSDNCGIKFVNVYIDDEKIRLTDEQVINGIIVEDPADYRIYIRDVNGNSRNVRFTIK